MKNPLHYFDSRYARHQPAERVAKMLDLFLYYANEARDGAGFVGADDREIPLAIESWIKRLIRYGVTKSLIAELNAHMLKQKGQQGHLVFDIDAMVLRLEYSFGVRDDFTVGLVAYVFCELLQRDCFRNLKRCAAADCSKFHIRRGKWCDDGCGSRERQRAKRRRDKEGQML